MLKFFVEKATTDDKDYVSAVAANTKFWGEDLTAYPGFTQAVANGLAALRNDPVAAVKQISEVVE